MKKQEQYPAPQNLGFNIAVLMSGFVYVGHCSVVDGFLLISKARNIRTWGTTKGLSELKSGATSKTILDDAGEVLVPWHSLNHLIKCTKEW